MRWLFSFALCAALAAGQSQSVQRDGKYWVRSGETKPQRLSTQVKRFEIFTRGNVVVRGSQDGLVRISMQQRVRAASEEDANRVWGPNTKLSPFVAIGNVLRLELYPPGSMGVTTDIEVQLPRLLPVVWINNRSGSVEVYDFSGSIQADTGGGPMVFDRINGNLRAHTGLGEIQVGTVGGSVHCSSGGGTITLTSAGGEMNCATGGGDITAKSVGGVVNVSTEGGNVRVEKAGNMVRARSMAGLIEVVEARGAVFADSGGGSIQVGAANGVRAESAAGTIRVKGGSGPMTVSTMMGNILAELMAGGQFADSSLAAETGDITVLIPEGLGLVVRARNDAGLAPRIVSDFPEIQVRSIGFKPPVGQGSIQGGGPVLDLSTSRGAIYLRRTK